MPVPFLFVAFLLISVIPTDLQAKVRAKRVLPAPPSLRSIREAAGLTQAEIASILGVTRESVCRWEAGARTPRGSLLVAYVHLLDELQVMAS